MIRRVVVAGGGTGGHLFPGVAVVEELRRRYPSVEVTFVGTARGIEARVLPKLGESLELLSVTPLKGMDSLALFQSLSRLPLAAASAMALLRKLQPDLVLGVGGYASGPVLSAAYAMQIPSAILEQNAKVGLTNRLLARTVGRAYLAFEETKSLFPAGVGCFVGNPLRAQLVAMAQQAWVDPEGFDARGDTVLVLGGSQGSKKLNETVPGVLGPLLQKKPMRVLHQVGRGDVDSVRRAYGAHGIEADVVSFIDDMASAYRKAALVIARAGASTVAELTAVGRPSVLVPYPHAADDHQRINAEALVAHGAAHCVLEETLADGGLDDALGPLLASSSHRRSVAEKARSLGKLDAAAVIVDDLHRFLGHGAVQAPQQPSALEDGTSPRTTLRGARPYIPRSRVRRCALAVDQRWALGQCFSDATS